MTATTRTTRIYRLPIHKIWMRRRGGIDAILALLRYLSSAPAAKSARDQQKGPTCAVAYKIRNSQVALNLALASVVGDWPYCRRLQSLLGSTRGAKRAAKNLTVFVARTTQWRAPMTRRRWSVDATTQIDMLKVQIADGAKRIEHQRTIVQSLRLDGHQMLADEAEEFLSKLVALQSNYIDQLARLQNRNRD